MNKYTLIEEKYLSNIKECARYYKHNKSGARIITIKSSDPNKVFAIAFKTAPINSCGLTHILEHSVLCGSKKYPVKDPFVLLSKTSLSTYLNAFTAPEKTVFPIASLNLKDFKNLMDVYLDAVFNPLIYEKKAIFLQEGWHYEFDKESNSLNVNGVVYNEMKGVFSNIYDIISNKVNASLFPNVCYKYESGGDPKEIPHLKYEDFLEYHKKYYVPANSYIFLYGDLDMDERLDYLDKEYLSKYDSSFTPYQINFENKFENPIYEKTVYQVQSDDLENEFIFTYNVAINSIFDAKKITALGLILTNLDSESSVLRNKIIDNDICTTFEIDFNNSILEPTISFIGRGAKKENEEVFYKTIETELERIVNLGIDKEEYESNMQILEFSLRENYIRYPKGIAYFSTILSTIVLDESKPFEYFSTLDYFTYYKNNLDNHYFEDIIKNDILLNNHKSLITFIPSKTLKDEEEKEQKDSLKHLYDRLDETQKEVILNDLNLLNDYIEYEDKKEDIDKMPKLALSDIKIEPLHFNISKVNDYTYLSSYSTNGIIYKDYRFKLDNFSNEEIQYIKLFAHLLDLVNTKNYTYQELDKLEKKYTGLISTDISVESYGSTYIPYFKVNISYYIENREKANEILSEILFNSDFSDKKRLKELISQELDEYKHSFIRSGSSFAESRVLSYTDEIYSYIDNIKGVGFLEFLLDLNQNFDSKADNIINILNSIYKKIFVLDKFVMNFTGTKEEYDLDLEYINKFIKNFELKYVSNNKFIFKPNILNEAFIIPSNVNYVAFGSKVGCEFKKCYDILDNFITMEYLWPHVRVRGGAYGVNLGISEDDNLCFSSYRDPHIKSSLETYRNTLDFVKNLDINKETLDHIKITSIGSNNESMHSKKMGNIAFSKALLNITYEDTYNRRKSWYDATLSELKSSYKLFEEVNQTNAICVVGSKKEIEKNKELFKQIRKLF